MALWFTQLLCTPLVPFYLSNWFNDWIIYTARGIGESCNNSIQCEAKTPYSTCDTDKRCRCEQGYLALNDSCSPGIPLIYRNLVPILFILYFLEFYTFDDYFHLVCKYTTIFHKGDNSTIHVTIPYNVQQSTQMPPAIKGQVFVSVQKVTWLYQADASMVNFMLDWFKQFSFQKAQWNSTMNNVNCCFDLDL